MDFIVRELTQDFLRSNLPKFIKISTEGIADEYWNEANFLLDLNRKWELSFFSTDRMGTVMGFIIASEKVESIHIHKFVVNKTAQGMGLGTILLDHLKMKVTSPITLKVDARNERAIQFYTKRGFVISSLEGNLYHMILRTT